MIIQLSTDWQLIGDKEVGLWHTLRWIEVVQTGVGQPLMQRKTSYFDQTCNEFISDWVVMACLGPKPIKVLFKD
jgi:hypothetical protein